MAMFELRTMDTAHLRNELISEICGFHRLVPNGWLKRMATTFFFKELVTEICGVHCHELKHCRRALLYISHLSKMKIKKVQT